MFFWEFSFLVYMMTYRSWKKANKRKFENKEGRLRKVWNISDLFLWYPVNGHTWNLFLMEKTNKENIRTLLKFQRKIYCFHSQNLRKSSMKPFTMFLLAHPGAYKREFVSSFRGKKSFFLFLLRPADGKSAFLFHCPVSFPLHLGDVKRTAVQDFFSWFSMVPMFFSIFFFFNCYLKQNKI